MPNTIEWYIEGQVLSAKAWGQVDIEGMTAYAQEVTAYLDAATRPIHLIVDDSQIQMTANNPREGAKALSFTRHPRMGWIIAVGKKNLFINFISIIVVQLQKIRMRRVDTFEEAIIFLKEVDSTLDFDKVSSDYHSNDPKKD